MFGADIKTNYEEMKRDKVQMVYTNDLNIKPCVGCMVSRTMLKYPQLSEKDKQKCRKAIKKVYG